ncbi:MAG: YfcC family protein, partial [Cutibacterium avidum]|nr:YfcC family protein [Cutibacterium avidum]
MSNNNATATRHRLRVPSAFTILFVLTVLAVACTWLVPAGSYSKMSYSAGSQQLVIVDPHGTMTKHAATQETLDKYGVAMKISEFTSGSMTGSVSVPGTYQRLASHPAGIGEITNGMVTGTIEAVDIIVFILVLGGLIGVVRASGAFEAGLGRLTAKSKGKEFLLVLSVSLFMIVGGTTCGLEEEAVAFYPILAPVFIAMGYDALVVVGSVFLAGSIGTCFSTINPFSSAIGANAAGIRLTEGMPWRVVGLVGGAVAVVIYLAWYSRKVKADPEFSYVWEDRDAFAAQWGLGNDGTEMGFDWRRKVILVLFASAFPIMVWGVMARGWWFPAMASSFLAIAIVIMFIAATGPNKISEKKLVDAFSAGSSSLVAVSLIIGLARGINHILNEGLISDTLLYESAKVVSHVNGPVFVLSLLIVFFLLGFIV